MDNKRTVNFTVDAGETPKQLRRFMFKPRLRVTSHQEMCHQEMLGAESGRITVKHTIKLHVFGSGLFKIRPSFSLFEQDGCMIVDGTVEHHAILPPPLNTIAEAFMCRQSEKELESYKSILLGADSLHVHLDG